MSDPSAVLRRKVAPARAAIPGGSAVAAMLRKVLPRIADKFLSMDVFVSDVRFGLASKSEVLEGLSDFDLIYLMEADREQRGIASLTPGLLAALIEIQVSGRVTERDPPERPATRTDGIVAGDIVDRWMEGAQDTAEEDDIADALPTIGYRRIERVLNKRNTDLVLDPVAYKTLAIEFSIEGGAKTGVLSFALPPVDAVAEDDAASQRIMGHLPEIEAPMVAILTRMPVPIEKVKNLAVDDILKVPAAALTNVQLEGQGGQKIVLARLGQLNGMKAVRLLLGNGIADGASHCVVGELGGSADLAEMPSLPEPAALPGVSASDMPELPGPDLGAKPELPGGDADGSPDLPGFPAMEGSGDLPDLPPMDAGGDLPDLPSLDSPGGLPDLPDLPELPPLEP